MNQIRNWLKWSNSCKLFSFIIVHVAIFALSSRVAQCQSNVSAHDLRSNVGLRRKSSFQSADLFFGQLTFHEFNKIMDKKFSKKIINMGFIYIKDPNTGYYTRTFIVVYEYIEMGKKIYLAIEYSPNIKLKQSESSSFYIKNIIRSENLKEITNKYKINISKNKKYSINPELIQKITSNMKPYTKNTINNPYIFKQIPKTKSNIKQQVSPLKNKIDHFSKKNIFDKKIINLQKYSNHKVSSHNKDKAIKKMNFLKNNTNITPYKKLMNKSLNIRPRSSLIKPIQIKNKNVPIFPEQLSIGGLNNKSLSNSQLNIDKDSNIAASIKMSLPDKTINEKPDLNLIKKLDRLMVREDSDINTNSKKDQIDIKSLSKNKTPIFEKKIFSPKAIEKKTTDISSIEKETSEPLISRINTEKLKTQKQLPEIVQTLNNIQNISDIRNEKQDKPDLPNIPDQIDIPNQQMINNESVNSIIPPMNTPEINLQVNQTKDVDNIIDLQQQNKDLINLNLVNTNQRNNFETKKQSIFNKTNE